MPHPPPEHARMLDPHMNVIADACSNLTAQPITQPLYTHHGRYSVRIVYTTSDRSFSRASGSRLAPIKQRAAA